ncbi:MAG: hypothetical protein K2N74_00685, partial [Clostridiales bacterium]|nr:hypothetical protein [Clostridiales bacterium]
TNLTATAVSTSNPNYTVEGCENAETTSTINPIIAEIEWVTTVFEYTGDLINPVGKVTNLLNEEEECTFIIEGGKVTVGTYEATVVGFSNGNYTVVGAENTTVTFTIFKAELELSLESYEATFGTPFPIVLIGNVGGGEVMLEVEDGTGSALLSGESLIPTHVGTVKVKITVGETMNTEEGYLEATITIHKGVLPIVLESATTVYGTDLILSILNCPEGGNIQFALSTDPTYVSTGAATITFSEGVYTFKPTAAGIVYVFVTADETENYVATEKTVPVEIQKLAVTLSWAECDFTYNGTEQVPEATVTNLVGTDTCIVTVEGGTDAGKSITARAISLSNDNYTLDPDTDYTTEYEIKPRPIKVKWQDNLLLEYTGSDQAPEATVENLVSGDECGLTVSGAATEIGPHTATVTACDNSNYTVDDGINLETDYQIVKASLTLIITPSSAEYDALTTLTVSGNLGGGEVEFKLLEDTDSAPEERGAATLTGNQLLGTRAGYVVIQVSVPETENYLEGTASIRFTITKKAPTIALDATETVYGTELLLGVSGNVENGTVTYTVDTARSTGEADIVKRDGAVYLVPKKVGLVYLNIETTETENYSENITSAAVRITPLQVDLGWGELEFVYNGKFQAPTAVVKNLLEGDKCEITVTGQQLNAGTYAATASGLTNSNYTLEGLINTPVMFSIGKTQ